MISGLGVALGAAALGCNGSLPGDPGDPGDPDAGTTPPDGAPPDDDLNRCIGDGGLSPEQLLQHIDTFVILCMENRSFDHYLGSLRLLEGRMDIDGLTGNEYNLNRNGEPVGVHLLETFKASSPPHSWKACHAQWNNGANDRFVLEHSGRYENEAMGYHVREQLPVIHALADAGAVCNRWFSSLLGPTFPNRWYLHGATSRGRKRNYPPLSGFRDIFDLLDDAGISHTNYFHDVAWATGAYYKRSGLSGIERYFEAAAAGTLPQVSIIDPKFFGSGANDDHPSHDVRLGQALMGAVFTALAQSPQWERSLFIVTYDEHGGFYDHVPPPTTVDERAEFRQLGFRVPSILAGPSVRQGCAVDTTFEHTSVLATLTRRFGLEVLNDRVAATHDLSPCIDPGLIGQPQPPPTMPPVDISLRAIEQRAVVGDAHEELSQALATFSVPRELDRRGRDMEVTRLWLEHAHRLGAVRVTDL